MSFSYPRSSRRLLTLLIAVVVAMGAWLSDPVTGNQFFQRMLGGPRPRSPQSNTRTPQEETRSGPALVDTPLNVQGAPRLPRSVVQQSVQATTGESTLDQLVAQAIDLTSRRYLDVQQEPPYTPWQIIHGVLALRENYILKRGSQYIRALDYISSGPVFMGDCWFQRTSTGGRARPYNNVPYAFEGHINQTLALLSMSNLPLDHEIRVADGGTVTMQDMVNTAQATVNAREEITWTLWFLTHYTDQLSQWTNNEGEAWSIERMLRLQIDDPVYSAPCGGCHGLFALSYARNAYLVQHGELRGVWLEADQKVQRYIAAAQSMQNGDGSFSSKYFKSRGTAANLDERIRTSGHMFEWLMMALPTSRLEEEWVRRGAARIATDIISSINEDTELGGLYHACHSLVLYQQRMEQLRGRQQSPQTEELANVPEQNVESPEPAPLSLPQSAQVAELPQRREATSQESITITPRPAVEAESESTGVPLIVEETSPEPIAATPSEPDATPQSETEERRTPPLILMPEALPLPPSSTLADQPTEAETPINDNEVPSSQIPLLVADEPMTDLETPDEPVPAEPTPAATTENEETVVATPSETDATPEQPTRTRPGLSFFSPNRDDQEMSATPAPGEPSGLENETPMEVAVEPADVEPTEPQAPETRVFTLPLPETGGSHKPQTATSTPPARSGSRPITGATSTTTPR